MRAQVPEVAAVLARLEKVERQNQRLRGAGIAVFGVGRHWATDGSSNAEGADSGGGAVCP